MKKTPDSDEKTSRRSFAKNVANALVGVPVISSLSSHSQPPDTTNRSAGPTPAPQFNYRAGNPPVIIDGGSLGVSTPATLTKDDDNETTPKQYDDKYREKNNILGPIKAIRITNDYGDDLVAERELRGATVKVYLWIQKVKSGGETGDDDLDTDAADYDDTPLDPNIPHMIIQGGALEIRTDKRISKARKLFKREGRNHKRYERHDWDNKPFRIAQVQVWVSDVVGAPIYTSTLPAADRGFRIILMFGESPRRGCGAKAIKH